MMRLVLPVTASVHAEVNAVSDASLYYHVTRLNMSDETILVLQTGIMLLLTYRLKMFNASNKTVRKKKRYGVHKVFH